MLNTRVIRCAGRLAPVLFMPRWAMAADAPVQPGDTAWLLTATVLVLFMTLPGLAAFYGGLVRQKNVLSVLMQCFAISCVVSLLWIGGAYGLAFSDGGSLQGFIGSMHKWMFAGVSRDTVASALPETVYAMFQLTFAIITPALIIGGFAERMR